MRADLVVRDFLRLQQVDEMLARHAEIVGRGLRGEGLVLRHEHDGLALGHEPHDAGEVGEEGLGQMGAVALRVDQRDMVRLGEDLGQFSQLVFGDQRRVQAVGAGGEHNAATIVTGRAESSD
jgi:hypothetical protein